MQRKLLLFHHNLYFDKDLIAKGKSVKLIAKNINRKIFIGLDSYYDLIPLLRSNWSKGQVDLSNVNADRVSVIDQKAVRRIGLIQIPYRYNLIDFKQTCRKNSDFSERKTTIQHM